MHDFLCSDPEEMETEMLAKEVKELKSKKGDVKMCKLMEDLIKKEKIANTKDNAKSLLAIGLPADKIAEGLELPLETVEALARDMQKNAVNV